MDQGKELEQIATRDLASLEVLDMAREGERGRAKEGVHNMGWKEILILALTILKLLAGKLKLFVKVERILKKELGENGEPIYSGWLMSFSEDHWFLCWRVSGGLPDLSVLTTRTKDALLEDLSSGKLSELGEVLCVGQRQEMIDFLDPYFSEGTETARFICLMIEDLEKLLDLFGDPTD